MHSRRKFPDHRNRSPEEIVQYKRFFETPWYVFQALSWLDYAKKNTNVTALQYAALELRYAIELLWFEIIISGVGGNLDLKNYSECKSNTTKMYKILKTLIPDYKKLVDFTNICSDLDKKAPHIIEWDMGKLMRAHGNISDYLHFHGAPEETWDKPSWFVSFMTLVEQSVNYLKNNLEKGRIGLMRPEKMPPAVKSTWDDYRDGKIDKDGVRTRLDLAHPVLQRRRNLS